MSGSGICSVAVTTSRIMISEAVTWRRSFPCSMTRKRSNSLTRPTSVRSSSTTGTLPKFPSVKISANLVPFVSGLTVNTASSITCLTVTVLGSQVLVKYSVALMVPPFPACERRSFVSRLQPAPTITIKAKSRPSHPNDRAPQLGVLARERRLEEHNSYILMQKGASVAGGLSSNATSHHRTLTNRSLEISRRGKGEHEPIAFVLGPRTTMLGGGLLG